MSLENLQTGDLSIHFDIPSHGLPLQTFIETASSTEHVVEALVEKVFNGGIEYKIIVLPPEVGSFKTHLKIAVISIGATLGPALLSDFTSGFIEGLTKSTPTEWGKIAGQELRELFSSEAIANEETEKDEQDHQTKNAKDCIAIAKILASATQNFMQSSTKILIEKDVTPHEFRDAYSARNDFYKSCLENQTIQGVSFFNNEKFEIPRSAFIDLQTIIPPKHEPYDKLPWYVEITTIVVTSPNWEKNDNRRQWKGKDTDGHDRYFMIEDDAFWFLAEHELLNFHFADRLRVQIKYNLVDDRKIHNIVLKVIKYNDRPVSTPLSQSELEEFIGDYKEPEKKNEQLRLFEE
ncbi:hypothetical protein [Thalassospira sp. TSL5-1]|uniref:hypothetical protein n=1 Tax=Thalassospira sp. TSL5-1 TaxID=1544451 RepID=UPI000939FD55|nr:hypothetical protein [Thalassospira sp. TSL5-1]OKH87722.1 hypothetical protein LF95_13300 [Thalassospira sp. TSL5-1]